MFFKSFLLHILEKINTFISDQSDEDSKLFDNALVLEVDQNDIETTDLDAQMTRPNRNHQYYVWCSKGERKRLYIYSRV